MRTDRARHDPATSLLLAFEKRLHESAAANGKRHRLILKDILGEIRSTHHIHSSLDFDRFLQLSMLYVAASLHFDFQSSPTTQFRVSTSIYNPKHDLFVIKPSHFYPGRCSVRHPTILLQPRYREAKPFDQYIGLSGLALIAGEVLHCVSLENCAFYVRLESRSASALGIPLTAGLDAAIDRFQRAHVDTSGFTSHCCGCRNSLHNPPRPDQGGPGFAIPGGPSTYGVLNIDCSTGDLDLERAKRIVSDADIQQVLRDMVSRMAGHQADRSAYLVLRTCTALFELSQHTLGARQGYVTLLREISEVCDGADVTLHLKTMFDDSDRDRSVRLVAGVGSRFRAFLIGERYGDGLVGKAIAENQFVSLDPEEIQSALTEHSPYGYRRLMPETALNAALPVRFQRRVIGAINIEWDEAFIGRLVGRGSVDDYLQARQSALERMASYISLVVDYYDDRGNPVLVPPAEVAHDSDYVRSSASRRRVLAYYVGSALKVLDGDLTADTERVKVEQHQYLRDIIDAVGYFLTFESKHRILASVRRKVKRGEDDNLDLVYDHGFDRYQEGPAEQIPIAAGESVLGTCAHLGVPVYGRVEEARWLRPDPLCLDCAPAADREILGRGIKYKSAGHHPAYEVGLPLVFGGDVLGTFDFELFSVDHGPAQGAEAPVIKGHELWPFLEWARAITFCMAYADDALHEQLYHGGLAPAQRAAYRRFQRLCAQIIANVAIPKDVLTSIAGEYLREMIPIQKLRLVPASDAGGGHEKAIEDAALPCITPDLIEELHWRGQHLGTIELTMDRDTVPPRGVFPGPLLSAGTSRLAQSFIVSFYTAAHSADQWADFDSNGFKGSLRAVKVAFAEKVAAFKQRKEFEDTDPYGIIESYFGLLDQALRERLLFPGGNGPGPWQPAPHGWFLYMAQCVEDQDGTERAILRCGSPFARWASMSTQELGPLITKVLKSPEWERAFARIVGESLGREILQDPRRRSASLEESLECLFIEALARRDREYPDPHRKQEPSLTTTTARLKRVQSIMDLNRSPLRSTRRREWFFGDQAYSVIALPILLDGKDNCIGVLQIFRRRDVIDDVLFFKNDEIQAVRDLGEVIREEIAEAVEYLRIPVIKDRAGTKGFTSAVDKLGNMVRDRIAKKRSPIVVVCDFLADATYSERFLEKYILAECQTYTIHQLMREEDRDLDMMSRPVVCVLSSGEEMFPEPIELKRKLGALTNSVNRDRLVVIFVSPSGVKAIADILESHPFLIRQEGDSPVEILPIAFGLAEGREGTDREEIGILFRREPAREWTIAKLVGDCGNAAGMIRRHAPYVLARLKDRQGIARRLFPNWYQNRGGGE